MESHRGRLGSVLEMFAHFFGQTAHADTGEVVDCEAGVPGIGMVHWEDAFEAGSEDLIFEAGLEGTHSHCFREILEEDFDKDTAAGGRFFFVEVDD